MADAQTPVLTDEQIEAALQKAGGRWSGDYWVIEDADLHPFVRGVLAAQAPAQPAEAVAWEYRNQHGNPFLSHTDPHKWHPHDQEGFGQFRALVYAAPSQPDRAVMQQALDALETIASLATGEGDVCEIIAKRARAAIAALSASIGQVSEPRDG